MIWGGYGVIICYCSNFLKSMNFQDSHVSIVMGTASGLAILVQLFLAELIQRINFLETAWVIAVQGAVILAAGLLMFQNTGMTAIAVAGIAIGCVALQTLPSLSNSLATTITAGSLIALYFGEFICQYAGVNVMVETAAVLAFAGFLIICRSTKEK